MDDDNYFQGKTSTFRKLSNIVADKLSWIIAQVYLNRLESVFPFTILIIIEHISISFVLVVSSAEGLYELDYFQMFQLQKNLNNSNYTKAIQCIAFGNEGRNFLLQNLLKNETNSQFRIKSSGYEGYVAIFVNLYAILHRTLITPLFFYFFTNIICQYEVGNFDHQSQTSIEMIVLVILSFGAYVFNTYFCFNLISVPLLEHQFQWASYSKSGFIYEEIVKALIFSEIPFKLITHSERKFMIPYLIVMFAIQLVANFKVPDYCDRKIQRVHHICHRISLAMNFFCLIKVTFYVQLEEYVIFLPIVAYAANSIIQYYRTKTRRSILKSINSDLNSQKLNFAPKQLEVLLKWFLDLLRSEVTEDLILQKQIIYTHRQSCTRVFENHETNQELPCICKSYNEKVIFNFNDKLKSLKYIHRQRAINKINEEFEPIQNALQSEKIDLLSIGFEEVKSQRLSPYLINKIKNEFDGQITDGTICSKPSYMLNQSSARDNEVYDSILNYRKSQRVYDADGYLKNILENSNFIQNQNTTVADLQLEDFFPCKKPIANKEFDNVPFQRRSTVFRKEELNIREENKLQDEEEQEMIRAQNQFKTQKEARQHILIKIMATFMNELELQQGINLQLKDLESILIQIQFLNKYQKKHYSAIFMLMKLRNQRSYMSLRQKVLFDICETFILQDALSSNKEQPHSVDNYKVDSDKKLKQDQDVENIDFSYYMDGNHIQVVLDQLYLSTTEKISEFWSLFQIEGVKIGLIIKLGSKISRDIGKIKEQTMKYVSQEKYHKDVEKLYTYVTFFSEVINDALTTDDIQNHIKIILMKRITLDRDGVLSNMIANLTSQGVDFGFALVNAWGGSRQRWEFMYGNRLLCNVLKISEEDIVGKDINLIIPITVGEVHNYIIKRFFIDGVGRFMKKGRALLARNAHGHLVPVSVKLEFYHHYRYGYAFIAMVEFLKEFNLYLDDHNKNHSEDVLIIMTDNHLNIVEHSSNILQFTGWTPDDLQANIEMTGYVENLRNLVQESQDLYEEAVANDINKNAVIKTGIANRIAIFKRVNRQGDNPQDSYTSLPCVISLVRKPLITFHSSLVMNIFLILPMQLHPDCDLNTTLFSRTKVTRLQLPTGNYLNQFLDRTEDSSRQNNNNFVIGMQGDSKNQIRTLNSIAPFRKEDRIAALNAIGNQIRNQQRDEQANKEKDDSFQAIEFDLSSLSSSGSQSSSHGSQKGANYVKSFLFKQRTPRILKINMALIIIIVLVYLLASTYNLFTFLDKHKSIRGRVNAMCLINSRNTHFRSLMLNIKILQHIAQNITGFNKSNVLPSNISRVDFYYQNMIQLVTDIDSITKDFDYFSAQNREYLSYNYEFNEMKYVTNLGYLYYVNKMQLKQASNTLTEYARSLLLTDLLKEKPSLNVTNYAKNYSSYALTLGIKDQIGNRSLTTLERNLFAVFENGLYRMFELFYYQYFTLKYISQRQTTESLESLNQTTFISIGVVLLICLIIYPLFIRAANNILYPLQIFNSLDRSLIATCQQKSISYLDYMETKKENQKTLNQAGFINGTDSILIPNVKEDPTFKDRSHQHPSTSKDNESVREFFNSKRNSQRQLSMFGKNKLRNKEIQRQKAHNSTQKILPSKSMRPEQGDTTHNKSSSKLGMRQGRDQRAKDVVKMKIEEESSQTSSLESEKNERKNIGNNGVTFHNLSYAKQLSIQRKQSSTQNLTKNVSSAKYKTNQKHSRSKGTKTKNGFDNEDGSDEDSEEEEKEKSKRKSLRGFGAEISKVNSKFKNSQTQSDESRKQNYIEQQIRNMSLKLKVITFFITVILGIYYTSSFMVSYYMSQQVFTSDKDCIDSLQVVFYREICNYDQITFVREKAIQNRTIYINFIDDIEGHTQASKIDQSFIIKAQESEKSLSELRKNLPVYLGDYGTVLDKTESDQICNYTFLNTNPEKAQTCEQALNQLFQRGFGQSLQYVNQNIQQIYVTFYGPHFLNRAYLDSIINNQKLQDLADLALYYQKYMHDMVQLGMQNSALLYFDRARTLYILTYVIYLAATLFGGLLLLIFSYLLSKRYMIDLQNMLIMIPFEQIPQEEKTKIEKHLQAS